MLNMFSLRLSIQYKYNLLLIECDDIGSDVIAVVFVRLELRYARFLLLFMGSDELNFVFDSSVFELNMMGIRGYFIFLAQ